MSHPNTTPLPMLNPMRVSKAVSTCNSASVINYTSRTMIPRRTPTTTTSWSWIGNQVLFRVRDESLLSAIPVFTCRPHLTKKWGLRTGFPNFRLPHDSQFRFLHSEINYSATSDAFILYFPPWDKITSRIFGFVDRA